MNIQELNAMTEQEQLKATKGVEEHPEGYEGPCQCDLCMFYAAQDGVRDTE